MKKTLSKKVMPRQKLVIHRDVIVQITPLRLTEVIGGSNPISSGFHPCEWPVVGEI